MRPQKKITTRTAEQDRLAEIYTEAARIICDKGFHAMSMNDIAQAVGMTKAGIYHYIQGKQEMLYAIMNFGMDSLDNGVILPASKIEDAEQRLHAIIQNHARLIAGGSHAVTVLFEASLAAGVYITHPIRNGSWWVIDGSKAWANANFVLPFMGSMRAGAIGLGLDEALAFLGSYDHEDSYGMHLFFAPITFTIAYRMILPVWRPE